MNKVTYISCAYGDTSSRIWDPVSQIWRSEQPTWICRESVAWLLNEVSLKRRVNLVWNCKAYVGKVESYYTGMRLEGLKKPGKTCQYSFCSGRDNHH
jgi:hypothetical protein